MERFNSRSHRFYSPDINETDEENAYLPFSAGNLHNRDNMLLGHHHHHMSFFSTASSNSSLSSGLSDTNSTHHLGQTAAIGSTTTNRFGLTDGLLLMNAEHAENIGQSLHDICTNSSATSRSAVYNSRLTAAFNNNNNNVHNDDDVDDDYTGVDENLLTLSSRDNYRSVYNNGNFIQNTRSCTTATINTMSSMDNNNNNCNHMHEYDMLSPYCSIVSFQNNNLDGQNFCIDCRYNHVSLGVQTCSCPCHNESKEVTVTPILNYTYTPTITPTTTTNTTTINSNNNRSIHSLNRPLSSDNYPTPTKHSSASSLSTITHPGLPSLTNAFTEQYSHHNSVNNTNAFGYFPISPSILTSNRSSNDDNDSALARDSPSPSTLDLTGDIRTVNFISHDQPPLRT
ncbi:unnamed protein product [Trichobilharzia szidati]|nr:unnamed protein product [Trichobilharzia szidati]